jgi:sugar-phosphatase
VDLDPLPPPQGLPIGLEALTGRTFAAVLFDMDGTLIDSTPAVARSWRRWAAEEGLDPARLGGLHGVPAAAIVELLLAERDAVARAASLERINAIELEDLDGIVVLPGAEAALTALAALDAGERAVSAIATSCTRPLALARIGATGLPAPGVVVTADDVERGKPDPAPYRLAAQRLGADPARCLVVEDAPAGLASGRAAGCATLAVATTHTVGALREAGPDAVVRDLGGVRLVPAGGGVTVQEAP